MKTKTEIDNELIDQSIVHWERMRENVRGNDIPTRLGCPLCNVYFSDYCAGCPVALTTEKIQCKGTPYMAAYRAFHAARANPTPENLTAWRTAAQAEIDFLKGLKK